MNAINLGFLAVNSISCLSAMFTNLVVIISIWRTPRLHTPSFVLIFSLAVSDFGVGLIVQPIFMVTIVRGFNAALLKAFQVCCLYVVGASVISMATIAVDRCLAVLLHMRYHSIVTTARAVKLTIFAWTMNTLFLVLFGLIDWVTFHYVSFSVVMLCVAVVAVCYFNIFRIVRRYRRQIIAQRQAIRAPPVKHGKSLKNMFYLHGFYALSFVPLVLDFSVGAIYHEKQISDTTVITFILFNSTVNPYLYFWRMKELRRAVVKIWQEVMV